MVGCSVGGIMNTIRMLETQGMAAARWLTVFLAETTSSSAQTATGPNRAVHRTESIRPIAERIHQLTAVSESCESGTNATGYALPINSQ